MNEKTVSVQVTLEFIEVVDAPDDETAEKVACETIKGRLSRNILKLLDASIVNRSWEVVE